MGWAKDLPRDANLALVEVLAGRSWIPGKKIFPDRFVKKNRILWNQGNQSVQLGESPRPDLADLVRNAGRVFVFLLDVRRAISQLLRIRNKRKLAPPCTSFDAMVFAFHFRLAPVPQGFVPSPVVRVFAGPLSKNGF